MQPCVWVDFMFKVLFEIEVRFVHSSLVLNSRHQKKPDIARFLSDMYILTGEPLANSNQTDSKACTIVQIYYHSIVHVWCSCRSVRRQKFDRPWPCIHAVNVMAGLTKLLRPAVSKQSMQLFFY